MAAWGKVTRSAFPRGPPPGGNVPACPPPRETGTIMCGAMLAIPGDTCRVPPALMLEDV